jgi:hypothetical protein
LYAVIVGICNIYFIILNLYVYGIVEFSFIVAFFSYKTDLSIYLKDDPMIVKIGNCDGIALYVESGGCLGFGVKGQRRFFPVFKNLDGIR